MKRPGLLSIACAAALTVACSRGDVRSDDPTATSGNDSVIGTSGETDRGGDSRFVHDLIEAGTAEIQLGKLATERAASADVKQFGQMMVEGHSKSGEALKQIATRFSIPADVALDEKNRELIDKLSKLRGAEFDREYIDAMVDGHEAVVDKLQSRVDEKNRIAVATGQEPKDTNVKPEAADNQVEASLNTWAADTLPVAKQHLERAKAIDDKLDAGRNTTASTR